MKKKITPHSMAGKQAAMSSSNTVKPEENFLILLVDDDENVRKVIRAMLELQGYSVMAAADPDEALNIFSRYRDEIGLIIIDIILPEMNGWELAFELKQLKPGIPVLFCSGYNCDLVRMDCIDRYIAKPFEMADLSGILNSMIFEIFRKFREKPVI